MPLMLASQEFYIAQYQENLNRLYWESVAHYAHMLPRIRNAPKQKVPKTHHIKDSEKKCHETLTLDYIHINS